MACGRPRVDVEVSGAPGDVPAGVTRDRRGARGRGTSRRCTCPGHSAETESVPGWLPRLFEAVGSRRSRRPRRWRGRRGRRAVRASRSAARALGALVSLVLHHGACCGTRHGMPSHDVADGSAHQCPAELTVMGRCRRGAVRRRCHRRSGLTGRGGALGRRKGRRVVRRIRVRAARPERERGAQRQGRCEPPHDNGTSRTGCAHR
jgi:hypothetical protein